MKRLEKRMVGVGRGLKAGLTAALRGLVLYLDDLLLLGAGVCFVRAAAEVGRGAAYLVAGLCLAGYAAIIARARRKDVS